MDDITTTRSLADITAPIIEKLALGKVDRMPVTDREMWLNLRTRDLTASDIANVAGCGRKSPAQVWAEKKGLIGRTEENAAMRRGRWLEPRAPPRHLFRENLISTGPA